MRFKFLAFLFFSTSLLIVGCESKYEAVMPYRNLGYTGESLFPVEFSSSDFEFRIWMNYSTSIDRVISVSKVNDHKVRGELYKGYTKSYLVEMGDVYNKAKSRVFYNKKEIYPKSGIDSFIAKIDSLKLFDKSGEPDSVEIITASDRPFSVYFVEIKENGRYHKFKFSTDFPDKHHEPGVYGEIQDLIFKEFGYAFYFKK